MSTAIEKTIKLKGRRIAVGHCVCLNHAEQPCGRYLAVITSVEGRGILRKVFCKYIGSDRQLSIFNKQSQGKGIRVSFVEELTPVERFGVSVMAVEESDGVHYWCERIGESKATYLDGEKRHWQEHGPRRYKARKDVLKAATLSERNSDE